MTATDRPTQGSGGTDPFEARLRHALTVVAESTPVPGPVADLAPLLALRPRDRSGDRPRPAWRLVAAAALLLVIFGGAVVVASQRDQARVDVGPADDGAAPDAATAPVSPDHQLSDHWHEAYGFYVCDTFLRPVEDADRDDLLGIHTHGDGVIHIHPFSAAASGPNARLGLFGEQIGGAFLADGWRLPDGDEYRRGSATCGGQPADVVVYRWSVDDPNAPPDVFTANFGDIVFDADRDAYTFAVVPEGTVPPRPPTIPTLDNLTDVPAPDASGPTVVGPAVVDAPG